MQFPLGVPVHRDQCQTAVAALAIGIILQLQKVLFLLQLFGKRSDLQALPYPCAILLVYPLRRDLLGRAGIAAVCGQEEVRAGPQCPVGIHAGITVKAVRKVSAVPVQKLQQLEIQAFFCGGLLPLHVIFVYIHVLICEIKKLPQGAARKLTRQGKARRIA